MTFFHIRGATVKPSPYFEELESDLAEKEHAQYQQRVASYERMLSIRKASEERQPYQYRTLRSGEEIQTERTEGNLIEFSVPAILMDEGVESIVIDTDKQILFVQPIFDFHLTGDSATDTIQILEMDHGLSPQAVTVLVELINDYLLEYENPNLPKQQPQPQQPNRPFPG